MTIKVHIAIYALITLALLVWFLVDLFSIHHGGEFFSGKRKGEMGLLNAFIIIVWFAFTLIWGGIFWW